MHHTVPEATPTKRFKYCSDENQETVRESNYPHTKYVLEYGKYVPGKQLNITVETDDNYDKNQCNDADKIKDVHLNTDFSTAIRIKYCINETQNVAFNDHKPRSNFVTKHERENLQIELNMSDGTVRHQNHNLNDKKEVVPNEKPPIKLFRPFLPDYESSKPPKPSTPPPVQISQPVQWQLSQSSEQQKCETLNPQSSAQYVPLYQTPQRMFGNYQPIYEGSETIRVPDHGHVYSGQSYQTEWNSAGQQYVVTILNQDDCEEINKEVIKPSKYSSGEFEQLLQNTIKTHSTEGQNAISNGSLLFYIIFTCIEMIAFQIFFIISCFPFNNKRTSDLYRFYILPVPFPLDSY